MGGTGMSGRDPAHILSGHRMDDTQTSQGADHHERRADAAGRDASGESAARGDGDGPAAA